MKEIITGSRAFFDGIDGFRPHDTDVIRIIEGDDVNFIFRRQFHDRYTGKDIFYVVKQPKEPYLRWATKFAKGQTLCQFLCPEFCNEFGITMEDLTHLQPLCDRLDYRHLYLAKIYEAYLVNGKMSLTDKQRMDAFFEYKKERNLI